MAQTTRKWTYRDPLVTVTYPAGTDADAMPAKQRKAAEDDGVLEAPKETENGEPDGAPAPSAPRAANPRKG